MTLERVLQVLLDEHYDDLDRKQQSAFTSFKNRPLTEKQIDWVYGVGEKLGVCVAPARNMFSRMPEEKQAEHAAKVTTRLPWERGEQVRALKPPGRGA